jgi:hypothetical protein
MTIDRHAAIRTHLEAMQIDLVSIEPDEAGGDTTVRGEVWRRISVPGDRDLHGIDVALPVEGRVRVGPNGEVAVTSMSTPSEDEISEATSFVESLAVHGQIAGVGSTRATRPTHRIETDPKGRRRLVRQGFSIV